MEALDAGDGMLAGRLVREHIEGFGRSVAAGLAGRSSESQPESEPPPEPQPLPESEPESESDS
jgi:hypothetical protein